MYPEYERISEFMNEAKLLEQTEMRIQDIFELTVTRNAKNKVATYVDSKGRLKSYTYKEFKNNALIMGFAINRILKNNEKGSKVILKVANNPHWGEVFYAISMAGFVPVLLDARLSKDNTINMAKQSKAIAIISDDLYEYDIKKLSLDDLRREKKPNPAFKPDWANEVIFCSSGTTGDAKLMVFNGANLSHQIMASLKMPEETKTLMYPKKYGDLNILAMIPFHHIFGFVAVFLWFTFYGKNLLYPASNATNDLLSICQKGDVTHVFSVPLLWDSLAQSVQRQVDMMGEEYQEMLAHIIAINVGECEDTLSLKEKIMIKTLQKKLLGRKVKYCISGGGYLSDKTSRFINGLYYPLYNGYGMTEIGVSSVELSPDVKVRLLGAIGKPLNGVTYKVLSNDSNNPNRGELLIKSGIVHIREIIGGVEQEATIDEEGYFHSGDIAEILEDGRVMIKGRIKDIIINSDGENIFPDELEVYFKKVPHVSNLCILGVSKKQSKDEDIVLVLELDNSISDEEFEALGQTIKEIEANLPKKVKLDNVFVAKGKLPIANNMKVKRFVIKEALESESTEYLSLGAKREEKTFEGYDVELVNSIREPLREMFSKILYLPKFKITDNGHWINDLGGDSMSYVELLQTIEKDFDVKIPEELYGQLVNINDFTEEIIKLKNDGK